MTAQPADKPAENKPATGDGKQDARVASFFSDFLRRYTPSQISPQKDVLNGRFRIELTVPLPEYNTRTAAAYSASDLMEPEKRLFALVCRPNTLQRHKAIEALKGFSHPNLLQLLGAGAVQLSQPDEERFVIVYERPQGQRLSEVLANAGQLGEHFLIRNIIAPIASALHAMSEMGVAHGGVNPDNIFFQDTPVLGGCMSEPCGYSQPFYFEPLERMQAHPAAKGEGDGSQDFYALAVLVLYALHGKQHFEDFTPDTLIHRIFHEGTYNTLSRNKDHPEIFYDFLRGVLGQNPEDRWSWRQIKPWLDGKRFNVLPPPPPADTVRPFEFEGQETYTRRELAHMFFNNWVNIPNALQGNRLLHWASVSLRDKTLAENITRINKTLNQLGAKSEIQLNEQLMRILLSLDPAGPIRMSPLSMHVDGIDTLCAEYYFNRQEKELNLLARFIDLNMVSFWVNHQQHDAEYAVPENISDIMLKLDRLRVCMRNTGPGFGMERVLYELNPDIPCLSPIFKGKYVNSIQSLLVHLDHLAPEMARSNTAADRHIFAYLTSKLGIQHDIRLHELEAVPALATNRDVITLRLLAVAQYRCGNIKLPGLTHWIALRILPAIDILRSNTLRNTIKNALMETAESGYTQHIAKMIINANYAISDHDGYIHAYRTYHANSAKIVSLRKGEHLEWHSARLGLTIAKSCAYLGFFITLMTLLNGGTL